MSVVRKVLILVLKCVLDSLNVVVVLLWSEVCVVICVVIVLCCVSVLVILWKLVWMFFL